jgi:hypothetical protein
MLNAIVDPTTGQLMEYRHLIADPNTRTTWMTAAANEFGRLMAGIPRGIDGTNTMSFIRKDEVPTGRMVTYARFWPAVITGPKSLNPTGAASP